MRPLHKGATPKDNAGNDIAPTDYKAWRKALGTRIGYYCAYCNIPLSHSLQVEHVVPKNPPPGFTPGDPIAWSNMLLACGPCNNTKSNKPVDSDTYYLPESHNTHLPFDYLDCSTAGEYHIIVKSRAGITPTQKVKAEETIDLLGLDAIDPREAVVDVRSEKRYTAQAAVSAMKELYDMAKGSPTYNALRAAELVATEACAIGFFSLWYALFATESLVMEKLTDNTIIKGTATVCFNSATGYSPIPRNPANVADPF